MKRLLIILAFTLLLVGCKDKQDDTLSIPTNIVYLDEALSWDPVKDASYYTVKINGNEQTTVETSLSLLNFENGSYDVQVRANKINNHSDYSSVLTITIARDYDIPKNLSYNDGVLSWSLQDNSTSYTIEINGENINVTDSSYNLTTTQNTLYNIRIKANYEAGSSLYSDFLHIHTYTSADTSYETDFNRLLPIGLDVVLANEISLEAFFVDDQFQSLSYITTDQEKLQFNGNWLTLLSSGTHTFTLLTQTSRIDINVTVYEDETPTMISSNTIRYTGEDMTFVFALFGGEISTFSAQNLTTSDYEINDNQITIYASFIDGILQANPNRETVIFSYTITKADDIKVGYIFIQTSD